MYIIVRKWNEKAPKHSYIPNYICTYYIYISTYVCVNVCMIDIVQSFFYACLFVLCAYWLPHHCLNWWMKRGYFQLQLQQCIYNTCTYIHTYLCDIICHLTLAFGQLIFCFFFVAFFCILPFFSWLLLIVWDTSARKILFLLIIKCISRMQLACN